MYVNDLLVQVLSREEGERAGFACQALESWKISSGADSLLVRFQSPRDAPGHCTGDTKRVPLSTLMPEDRFELEGAKTDSFRWYGAPAIKGSALAVCTVTPEQTFCSGAEVKIKAAHSVDKYKRGKSTLSFMVVGSYVSKKNPGHPTYHVSRQL